MSDIRPAHSIGAGLDELTRLGLVTDARTPRRDDLAALALLPTGSDEPIGPDRLFARSVGAPRAEPRQPRPALRPRPTTARLAAGVS